MLNSILQHPGVVGSAADGHWRDGGAWQEAWDLRVRVVNFIADRIDGNPVDGNPLAWHQLVYAYFPDDSFAEAVIAEGIANAMQNMLDEQQRANGRHWDGETYRSKMLFLKEPQTAWCSTLEGAIAASDYVQDGVRFENLKLMILQGSHGAGRATARSRAAVCGSKQRGAQVRYVLFNGEDPGRVDDQGRRHGGNHYQVVYGADDRPRAGVQPHPLRVLATCDLG